MSMIPNTSVRPAASRNSINPNCRPFSACSRIRIPDMGARRRAAAYFSLQSLAYASPWSVNTVPRVLLTRRPCASLPTTRR